MSEIPHAGAVAHREWETQAFDPALERAGAPGMDALRARVGMSIFLGSTSILFGALVFSYATLRARQIDWPPPTWPVLPAGAVAASLAIVACSSAALALAHARRRSRELSRQLIAATALLALLFVATQVRLLYPLASGIFHGGIGLAGGILLALLGVHAVHALAGAILLAILFLRTSSAPPGALADALFQVPEMFWHFLAILWLILLGVLLAV